MNPRLYQAMDLLHMPLLQLEQHLKQELTANPFLEMDEAQEEFEAPELAADEANPKEEDDDSDWEEILLNGFDSGYRAGSSYEEREYQERVPTTRVSLWDHLETQLRHSSDFTDEEVRVGLEIIGNIDEDGFLTCPLDDVADVTAASLERVAEVLRKLQSFDPLGVAARDLRECLLVQLEKRYGSDNLAYRIIADHFAELSSHKWNDLAKRLGITPKDVQDAADLISTLDPKPGREFGEITGNYVVPDLVVENVEGDYRVFLNDGNLPRLRISPTYLQLVKDKAFKGSAKEFVSSKLNSANWMVQAIEQRRQTMVKTMGYILERQREFFDHGVQYLKPLTLKEVADAIGMHESTISRVTNEKFCQTPRGVFRLKYFFSSGLSRDDGEDISARGIKARIQELVSNENPKRPLTDQKIVELLRQEGTQIARRTVQKYRDQLGILSSRFRKRV
ncbi:MAG: RNA polymerase factor sigma-54 [Gemmatimonadetes bacterium]|nr:RNA polymerase factor sigma-54 [Gemmatimonadota bacterium]